MIRLEAEALKMAAKQFNEVAMTAGFMRMTAEALQNLIDDDRLIARSEEAVWEAVVRWMNGVVGVTGRRDVMGKIRFPLMEADYLGNRIMEMVEGEDGEWMAGVVAEALRAKAARQERAEFAFKLLGRKALVDRVGLGVQWEEYREGGELRLGGSEMSVKAVVAYDGRIYSGSEDGSIRVWSRASAGHEKTLRSYQDSELDESDEDISDPDDGVNALAVWGGCLISGHDSGLLRVWDAATGLCDQVLEGHFRQPVLALAVCGSRLASGSMDASVKIWGMAPFVPVESPSWSSAFWPCRERRLLGHTGWVRSLAGWRDKVASGSSDGSIRVWDVGTGAHDATLAGHSGAVTALVVHGDRLLSASQDGTIRAWALGTWEELRMVEAYREGVELFPSCLAVSGAKLLSGSWRSSSSKHSTRSEVQVWGLEDLDLQQTLVQPDGTDVFDLLAVDGEVWGGVGRKVTVWGRKP